MPLCQVSVDDDAVLNRLKDAIFAGDNAACFLERERILQRLPAQAVSYTDALDILLAEVSTPVVDDDVFLGRVVEGRWPDSGSRPAIWYAILNSNGHMTLDWPVLLSQGLRALVQKAWESARRLGTVEAHAFAHDAARGVEAMTAYAQRYARVAMQCAAQQPDPQKRARLTRAAQALSSVPYGPATDLFTALQSIWLVHLITSCYLGARDFAFGRMDQYLYSYYEHDVANGRLSASEAQALLAHFFVKTNEITGTSTWNYQAKPIPSVASKQYLMLGGRDAQGESAFNDLTRHIIAAAIRIQMPEPVLTIRLDPGHSATIFQMVADATLALQSQVQIFNDAVIIPALRRAGVTQTDAAEYTMVGCCRADIGGCMDDGRMLAYHYHNATQWMLTALYDAPEMLTTFDQLLAQLRMVATEQLATAVTAASEQLSLREDTDFRMESLLLQDCIEHGRSYQAGGARYRPQGHFIGGIATVVNSLIAVKRLVYDEHRFTLPAFLAIVQANFAGQEVLRVEITTRLPKFGNDDAEVNLLASTVGTLFLDALETVPLPPDQILLSGFYSLDCHHAWGHALPATPDGRLAGEAVSENQSPVYGTDTQGITALLNSVAALPLARTAMGGLNIKFGGTITPAQFAALLNTYFRLGGIHLGTTNITRDAMLAAQANPMRYRSLCVRLYGYSEYFVALSPMEQEELIARTELA